MLEKLLSPWEEFQSVQFWWNYLTYGWVIITTHFDLICLVYILKVKSKLPKCFQGGLLSRLFPMDTETFLFGVCGHSTVSYCNSEFLKLFGCINNSFNKLLLILTVLRGYINSSETGSTRTKRTKKQHHVPLSFVAVKDSYRYKGQGKNKKQTSRDKIFLENTLFHLSSLRELISDLSLATKFYSFPRRPNFLGLLVSKSRQAHYPRLSDSLKRSSALLKFLNSLVPFSFGYIDPCRHLFSFFGNRTDLSAALLFIPDRRLYE